MYYKMDGRDRMYKECEKISKHKNNFEKFREEEQFRFLVNHQIYPDKYSIKLAKSFDENLFEKYLKVRKSKLGFSEKVPYSDFDDLDSRHYMMFCFIFSYFIKNNIALDNILEIGGGFGNWCYVNYNIINFKKWNIIDLEFVTKLQKWFLETELDNTERINIYNTKQIDDINFKIDLLICSHSLSEISKEKFDIYMEKIIKNKVKYFFYAYHKHRPNEKLIQYKKNKIDSLFKEIKSFDCEENRVKNILYVKK